MTNEANRRPGRPNGTKILRRPYMTQDELFQFMKEARKTGLKYDLVFSLVYYFAMRVAEMVNLRMEDFNLPSHQVTIKAMKGGRFRALLRVESLVRLPPGENIS